MMVVSVPLPAISGNAIGTTLPLLASFVGFKKFHSQYHFQPKNKNHNTSGYCKRFYIQPKKFKNSLPTNKKKIINPPEPMLPAWILSYRPFFRNDASTGIEPSISITANNVKDTVIISFTAIARKIHDSICANIHFSCWEAYKMK